MLFHQRRHALVTPQLGICVHGGRPKVLSKAFGGDAADKARPLLTWWEPGPISGEIAHLSICIKLEQSLRKRLILLSSKNTLHARSHVETQNRKYAWWNL